MFVLLLGARGAAAMRRGQRGPLRIGTVFCYAASLPRATPCPPGQSTGIGPGHKSGAHRYGAGFGGASVMGIGSLWDRLEPGTRQWFIDHPGCRILPRFVVAAINKATGTRIDQDRHGESVLSPGDCEFIRAAAHRREASMSDATERENRSGGYMCRACGRPASAVRGTGRDGSTGREARSLYCPDPRCPNSIARGNGRLGFVSGDGSRP